MTESGHIARLGILGGSFDPVHNGHIAVAQAALEDFNLDRVLLVPAANQWQKDSHAEAKDRVAMLELAAAGYPGLSVSDVDIVRGGATYTVDTLRDVQHRYPDAQLFFILGADAFAGIFTWKDSAKLPDLAQFIVVNRPDTGQEVLPKLSASVNLLKIPAQTVSSSQCRDLVAAGKSLEGLVPAEVEKYISFHQLYRSSS